MTFSLRPLTPADEGFLWEMLYYAAHMDDEGDKTPADAPRDPFLAKFVQGWGLDGDLGLAAVDTVSGRPVGAAWVRLLTGPQRSYDVVDDTVPELAIAVRPEYIGLGIGTRLLAALLGAARPVYPSIVLSVRDDNPARRIYERHGFVVVDRITNRVGGQSLVMVVTLQ
ncbi:MAG: GNAT family N-acetyltransferase [Anaerolineae bacterium]|nr:GNAT family N-acetyltransferase [Anaerolineae bacterium]